MRVLVVEDEHKIARAVKMALEQENFVVDVAYDGDTGYNLGTTESYDIVIIDRLIPGNYDGIAIVKAMRLAKIHTPILFLSVLTSANDKAAGLDAGADDQLMKPFALEDLLSRVRSLLRKPGEDQPTILTAADLTLDTQTFEVKRAGKLIPLTGKEFALLEFMLRNQGRPLNKELIISHVWDYDADILPNTVEVYIKYLRNKVDEPFDKALIHTVRGFGYKLEA
jgi:two-component system, OmpR family, response regulator